MKKFLNGYEMIDYGGGTLIGMIIGIVLIVLTVVVLVLSHEEWEYDYIDVNGNRGVSKHCETPSMGDMRCDIEGGKVQVNYYKGRKTNGN